MGLQLLCSFSLTVLQLGMVLCIHVLYLYMCVCVCVYVLLFGIVLYFQQLTVYNLLKLYEFETSLLIVTIVITS